MSEACVSSGREIAAPLQFSALTTHHIYLQRNLHNCFVQFLARLSKQKGALDGYNGHVIILDPVIIVNKLCKPQTTGSLLPP